MKTFDNLKEGDIITNKTDGDMIATYNDFYGDGKKVLCLKGSKSLYLANQFNPSEWEIKNQIKCYIVLFDADKNLLERTSIDRVKDINILIDEWKDRYDYLPTQSEIEVDMKHLHQRIDNKRCINEIYAYFD